MVAACCVTQAGRVTPLLTSSEHAACVRRLAELRRIRDQDIPLLLHEARQFVASEEDEEIEQLRDLLSFVTGRIARLEQRLRIARIAPEEPPVSPVLRSVGGRM
jgi:transcription elongation GreA/GreB family factor